MGVGIVNIRRWFRLEGHVSERSESRRRGEKSLTDLSRVLDEHQVAEMRSGVDTADRVDREEIERLGKRFE